MKRLVCAAAAIFVLLFLAACASSQRSRGAELARSAVFEVVIQKPDKDKDPLVYEKPLDWSEVPYQVRTDDYISIGTAFAISDTELVTAFHVMDLALKSLVHERYFVRGEGGKVCEVDQVLSADNERDFMTFTVKDCGQFAQHFEWDTTYAVDEAVYSIGNALGEGIVTRAGLVLGDVPEPEEGRWRILKSSAGINPGNSGGPLITPDGKVLAVITSMRDNILYSTPARAILERGRDSAHYRIKPTYGHHILANTLTKEYKWSAPLPNTHQNLVKLLDSSYKVAYKAAMEELFAEAPAYLTGENNAYLFASSYTPDFPQFDFVDGNDNNWRMNGLTPDQTELLHNGRILAASTGDFNYYKIRRPQNLSAAALNQNPQAVMDLILQNRRSERLLWQNTYRVLSFGAPMLQTTHTDDLSRVWLKAAWLIPHNDALQVLYLLPQPDGPFVVTGEIGSASLEAFSWDAEKLLSHLHAAYQGTFEEWQQFGALGKDAFAWDSVAGKVSLRTMGLRFALDSAVFPWSGQSELSFAPYYFSTPNGVEYSVQEVLLSQDHRQQNYLALTKTAQPDPRLGDAWQDNWADLVAGKYPYDSKPVLLPEGNLGKVSGTLPARPGDAAFRWTLYLEPQSLDSALVTKRFEALKRGIR
jgi:hypothetical protein